MRDLARIADTASSNRCGLPYSTGDVNHNYVRLDVTWSVLAEPIKIQLGEDSHLLLISSKCLKQFA